MHTEFFTIGGVMKKDDLESLILNNEMKIIFKYLIKLGASKEDAEDILQSTLCKTIEYIDVIDQNSIKPWLFKLSINNYYNLYNKRKKLVHIELDDITVENFFSEDIAIGTALRNEKKHEILTVLDAIGESYKNIILLKYSLDLKYKEIAEFLDIDEDIVKTYLYRARNKFKKLWEESGYDRWNK